MATNFSEYFEKLSKRLHNLSYLFPRMREYEKIFRNSSRLQQAMSTFYAIVVVFFTKSLEVLQERGIQSPRKLAHRNDHALTHHLV
jgi:5-methylcytosine-specific restriction endonuclease McrBC regulatory subunit McrC